MKPCVCVCVCVCVCCLEASRRTECGNVFGVAVKFIFWNKRGKKIRVFIFLSRVKIARLLFSIT